MLSATGGQGLPVQSIHLSEEQLGVYRSQPADKFADRVFHRQPLLKGAGYAYNHASLKVAQLDSRMAAADYIRSLENHLLEVNQAYWGIYLARASFMIRRALVDETSEITKKIENRPGEVTASDLLQSPIGASERRTSLIRSEMAVRNAEERLRALTNDPGFPHRRQRGTDTADPARSLAPERKCPAICSHGNRQTGRNRPELRPCARCGYSPGFQ